MNLFRLKLRPSSPWRTPWQADTLAGMLCWACARREGGDALWQEILEPALNREPKFVLSDAFPGDLLPVPEFVRLATWPENQRKIVRKARWLKPNAFHRAQSGESLDFEDLAASDPVKTHAQTRNQIDRLTDTTGEGGKLFTLPENWLGEKRDVQDGTTYLSVYVRVAEGFEKRLMALFRELAQTGFGADASVGKGQFDLVSDLEPMEQPDNIAEPNGVISLSTFQPDEHDPTDGGWQAFTKFGKLGPDFGLENVFKRPLLMLRPGAFFRVEKRAPFLGRAIPGKDLLSPEVWRQLQTRNATVAHLAFGLAVPIKLPKGSK